MGVDFPQIDQIMHASLDDNAFSQKEYVNMMNRCNNFINLTFQELLDRVSRSYNYKSIVDILSMVNMVIDEENDACESRIEFDDFVKNASLVSQSLKTIINSPSRKLVKIDKNVPANKVIRFDSKTMNWLSRRPGVTIEEKISPRNVIPTKVTYFSPDTVENRHTMYLLDILYDYLYEKIYSKDDEPKCETCPHVDKKCHVLYEKLKTILFLKQKVRTSDLKEVLKQKQLRQNNKLLSDKEYKQIWDAVRDIDFYEQNCKNVWDNLKERYQFISFLFVCAKIALLSKIKVFDCYLQLVDKDGKIAFKNENGEVSNLIKFYDGNKNNEIIVSLINESIIVEVFNYRSLNSIIFKKINVYSKSFDLSNIFSEFKVIEDKEKEYKSLVEEINNLKKDIQKTQDKIDEFNERKLEIQKLVNILIRKSLVVSGNGKKEK